mmetsp:Transcript_60267/g.67414  ORF Transcript_60267/g.67414 Transcript_60267/m.67414 type:complete len:133 (-) Transcript_60267:767-1165(-)
MDDDATTIISLPPVINVAVKSIRCNPIVLRFLPTDNAVDFQIRPMIYNSLSLSVIIYYDNNTVNSQRSKKALRIYSKRNILNDQNTIVLIGSSIVLYNKVCRFPSRSGTIVICMMVTHCYPLEACRTIWIIL